METDKKHQHYVWKNYLKPWATDKKIWCKRHDSIFNPSLNNIAQEKYFYEVDPLNEIEIRIATRFIEMNPPENRPFLIKKLAQYIYICNSNNKHLKKNAIEDYHARIENSIGSAFEYLYKKICLFSTITITKLISSILYPFNTFEQKECVKK